mmetsp:Transcript_11442/g.27861  ORF Transcript_11442/g.27861 Transcript_11442/m.27861 type:complete len:301 (+) Transcript_11442:86-988(+)
MKHTSAMNASARNCCRCCSLSWWSSPLVVFLDDHHLPALHGLDVLLELRQLALQRLLADLTHRGVQREGQLLVRLVHLLPLLLELDDERVPLARGHLPHGPAHGLRLLPLVLGDHLLLRLNLPLDGLQVSGHLAVIGLRCGHGGLHEFLLGLAKDVLHRVGRHEVLGTDQPHDRLVSLERHRGLHLVLGQCGRGGWGERGLASVALEEVVRLGLERAGGVPERRLAALVVHPNFEPVRVHLSRVLGDVHVLHRRHHHGVWDQVIDGLPGLHGGCVWGGVTVALGALEFVRLRNESACDEL